MIFRNIFIPPSHIHISYWGPTGEASIINPVRQSNKKYYTEKGAVGDIKCSRYILQ